MGTIFSSPSPPNSPEQQNPKPTATATATAAMSSPPPPSNPEPEINPPKTQEPEYPIQGSENPSRKSETLIENPKESEEIIGEEIEEDEEECGFCRFMKGGECKEIFINWEKCVEEGEKNDEDIVDKCFEATSNLKKCMEANQDYYGVILQAEKDAEQQVMNQLDQEKGKETEESAVVANSDGSSSGEEKAEQGQKETERGE